LTAQSWKKREEKQQRGRFSLCVSEKGPRHVNEQIIPRKGQAKIPRHQRGGRKEKIRFRSEQAMRKMLIHLGAAPVNFESTRKSRSLKTTMLEKKTFSAENNFGEKRKGRGFLKRERFNALAKRSGRGRKCRSDQRRREKKERLKTR